MNVPVTIPDAEVDDLEAFFRKRLVAQYPGWDMTGVDVLQTVFDDYAENQRCEAAISVARWAFIGAATEEDLSTARGSEVAAREAKAAMEIARNASRS